MIINISRIKKNYILKSRVVRHTFFIFLYGGFSLRFKNKEAKQIFFFIFRGDIRCFLRYASETIYL